MDFDVLANLSWREALIAIVALLSLYVLVVFIRLRRLKQGKLNNSVPEQPAAKSAAQLAVSAYAAEQQPEPKTTGSAPELLSAPSESAFPWNEPPAEIQGQQRIDALERELAQLRREVGGLRAEVMILREEQRREQAQSQAAQHVSPMYSDAMQMAIQGHDAASISQHCAIARAEAELVVALVRNRNN
jgi:hypothetical protein